MQGFALCHSIGEFQLLGCCFASNYWGITIARPLSCVNLLGNYNLQGLASRQAIEDLQFARFCVVSNYWGAPTCSVFVILPQAIGEAPVFCQASGEFQFAGSCFASGYWGITICKVLFCPDFLRGYNLQGRFCHVFETRENISRLRFIIRLINTRLHVAIPVHHIF